MRLGLWLEHQGQWQCALSVASWLRGGASQRVTIISGDVCCVHARVPAHVLLLALTASSSSGDARARASLVVVAQLWLWLCVAPRDLTS